MPLTFNLNQCIQLLTRAPHVYSTLLGGLPGEWVYANEGPDTWSPFDIMGHLIHGERTDWIPRAQIIMEGGIKPFEPFDRFAQFEASKGRTMDQLLEEFSSLREKNLSILRGWSLTEAMLIKEGTHPALGKVTLKQLLATWTVHDLNHVHQATRVMVKLYKDEVGPWSQFLKILS